MTTLKRPGLRLLALCSLVTLAGCQDGTAPGAAAQFSREEAQQIAASLFQEAMAASSASMSRAATVAAEPMSGTLSFDASCQRGGRVAGELRYSTTMDDQGTGALDMSMKITPTGCVVPAGQQRGTLAINGAPSLDYTIKQSFTRWEPSSALEATGKGGIVWQGGSCQLDYRMLVQPTGSAVVTGTFCGVDISGTYTGAQHVVAMR